MTVKELAEAADVSTGLISQVERGLTDPSLETLRRMARALGSPVCDLCRREEPPLEMSAPGHFAACWHSERAREAAVD